VADTVHGVGWGGDGDAGALDMADVVPDVGGVDDGYGGVYGVGDVGSGVGVDNVDHSVGDVVVLFSRDGDI